MADFSKLARNLVPSSFYKENGYIPLFRGTGSRGFNELKSTDGGVYGGGVYFYTDPMPARSHATYPGGGVVTGYAKPEDLFIKDNIAVLKDPSKFVFRGKLSLEDTLSTNAEWRRKAENSLLGLGGISGVSMYSPEVAQARQYQNLASSQALKESYSPVDLMIAAATGGAGMMPKLVNSL